MKILYLVNIARFFVSHRLPLALASRDAGYNVIVATSDDDPDNIRKIQESGLQHNPLPLAQHGINPFTELNTLQAIIQLYRDQRPDLVHHVSIKPMIYGGIAARRTGVPAVVGAVSGLGYVFTGEGAKPALLRSGIKPLYRIALNHPNSRVIFQNPDDQQQFVKLRLVEQSKTVLIRGSGVDTKEFSPAPEPDGIPVVLFAGRLLWKKGLQEFYELAKALQGKARFVIVGYPEASSPDSISQEQLQTWVDEGIIEFWGKRDDMPDVYAQSHIVCLPSTYGEGVPKVLIEAASCGRAIVTTDTPGCREITHDGENGFVVPPHDPSALAQATEKLIQNAALRQKMGIKGREIVEEGYSLDLVIQETFAVYRELGLKEP